MDTDRVEHDTAGSRFVLKRGDEELGETVYVTKDDGTIVFVHTEIDPERQEKGLGSTLVRGALDELRDSTEVRVTATCTFVRHFVQEHPEYQTLATR